MAPHPIGYAVGNIIMADSIHDTRPELLVEWQSYDARYNIARALIRVIDQRSLFEDGELRGIILMLRRPTCEESSISKLSLGVSSRMTPRSDLGRHGENAVVLVLSLMKKTKDKT